jgi:2-polyprenyl-3-methyl-5-hydroxy-6-metoxy-1,4-benzoquinol methylase
MEKWRWQIAQQAEIRWWRWYLRNKPDEHYRKQKKQYWWKLISTYGLEPSRDAHILDAGCGPAGIFMAFPNHHIDAVDPLLPAYEKTLRIFDQSRYPNTRFIHNRLEDYVQENRYDYIYCMNAINHVDDIELSLNNLTRCLKPSGKMILTVDVHRYNWLKGVFRLLPGDILHPQQHDADEYHHLLEARNMRIHQTKVLKRSTIFDYRLYVVSKVAIS